MHDELVCLDDDLSGGFPKFREGFPISASKWKETETFLLPGQVESKQAELVMQGYETKVVTGTGLFGIVKMGRKIKYRRPWWYPFEG